MIKHIAFITIYTIETLINMKCCMHGSPLLTKMLRAEPTANYIYGNGSTNNDESSNKKKEHCINHKS